MIVSSHNDAVLLRGALHKNEWLTIKALAKLLLQQHPQGILIDCTGLTDVSADGAKTFLEAMHDIQSEGARIIVVNLPDNVLSIVRSVPGVRSQLPIASSAEEARSSLRLAKSAAVEGDRASTENTILVPLIEGLDTQHAITIASLMSRESRHPVALVSLLVVARNLPLGAPLGEDEETAHARLGQAAEQVVRLGLRPVKLLERVRGVEEGLLHMIKTYKASDVVISAGSGSVDEEPFAGLLDLLLHRAPCGVIVGRRPKNS
jgi:anti-anti-sigma regulatory factor